MDTLIWGVIFFAALFLAYLAFHDRAVGYIVTFDLVLLALLYFVCVSKGIL